MPKTYAELLQHPRWQEKRLEVFQREGFACQWCGDRETTLHVHHTHYIRGAKPWEYDLADLLCLCKICHEYAEKLLSEIGAALGSIGRDRLKLSVIAKEVVRFAEVHEASLLLSCELLRFINDPELNTEHYPKVDPILGRALHLIALLNGKEIT